MKEEDVRLGGEAEDHVHLAALKLGVTVLAAEAGLAVPSSASQSMSREAAIMGLVVVRVIEME